MTRRTKVRLRSYVVLLAGLVILLDQLSKWWIVSVVMQPPRVIEVTGFFNLVLTFNEGVSFGFFSEQFADWQPWALSALALAITAGLFVWLWRLDQWLPALAIGLVAGGAIGNTLDRVFRAQRAVVDFLQFYVDVYYWPAFNVADSAICVGVALLLYDGLFQKPAESKVTDTSGGGRE